MPRVSFTSKSGPVSFIAHQTQRRRRKSTGPACVINPRTGRAVKKGTRAYNAIVRPKGGGGAGPRVSSGANLTASDRKLLREALKAEKEGKLPPGYVPGDVRPLEAGVSAADPAVYGPRGPGIKMEPPIKDEAMEEAVQPPSAFPPPPPPIAPQGWRGLGGGGDDNRAAAAQQANANLVRQEATGNGAFPPPPPPIARPQQSSASLSIQELRAAAGKAAQRRAERPVQEPVRPAIPPTDFAQELSAAVTARRSKSQPPSAPRVTGGKRARIAGPSQPAAKRRDDALTSDMVVNALIGPDQPQQAIGPPPPPARPPIKPKSGRQKRKTAPQMTAEEAAMPPPLNVEQLKASRRRLERKRGKSKEAAGAPPRKKRDDAMTDEEFFQASYNLDAQGNSRLPQPIAGGPIIEEPPAGGWTPVGRPRMRIPNQPLPALPAPPSRPAVTIEGQRGSVTGHARRRLAVEDSRSSRKKKRK